MIGVDSGLLPGRTPGLLSREVRGTFGRKERGICGSSKPLDGALTKSFQDRREAKKALSDRPIKGRHG